MDPGRSDYLGGTVIWGGVLFPLEIFLRYVLVQQMWKIIFPSMKSYFPLKYSFLGSSTEQISPLLNWAVTPFPSPRSWISQSSPSQFQLSWNMSYLELNRSMESIRIFIYTKLALKQCLSVVAMSYIFSGIWLLLTNFQLIFKLKYNTINGSTWVALFFALFATIMFATRHHDK